MPKTEPKALPFPRKDEEPNVKSNGYKKPTFIRCDLDVEQKKEMSEWANMLQSSDLLDYMEQSIKEGYVLSFKEIEKGYQASMTQSREASITTKNSGKSLVTRASTPSRAIWALVFKHVRILEGDWSRGNEEAELEW